MKHRISHRFLSILFLISLFTLKLPAAELWGYYEAELDAFSSPALENVHSFAYHKLRLNFENRPTRLLTFRAGLSARQYFGDSRFLFDEFVHPDYIPDPMKNRLSFPLSDTLFIDDLRIDYFGRHLAFSVGRQQMSPGCGYAWNPVDIINSKDIMDPTYEQPAQPGVSAVLSLPRSFLLTWHSVASPGVSLEDNLQMFILKSSSSFADLSISAAFTRDPSFFDPFSFNSRRMLGFTAETDIMGLGLRAEYAANQLGSVFSDDGARRDEALLGLDYTFSNSLYILAEYFHNGFGVEKEAVDLLSLDRSFRAVVRSLNRNYAFVHALYPLTDLSSAGLSIIANLDDGSASVNPQLDLLWIESLDIQVLAALPLGPRKSEFAFQDWAARLRLTAYF